MRITNCGMHCKCKHPANPLWHRQCLMTMHLSIHVWRQQDLIWHTWDEVRGGSSIFSIIKIVFYEYTADNEHIFNGTCFVQLIFF